MRSLNWTKTVYTLPAFSISPVLVNIQWLLELTHQLKNSLTCSVLQAKGWNDNCQEASTLPRLPKPGVSKSETVGFPSDKAWEKNDPFYVYFPSFLHSYMPPGSFWPHGHSAVEPHSPVLLFEQTSDYAKHIMKDLSSGIFSFGLPAHSEVLYISTISSMESHTFRQFRVISFS